jgi:hypothetical protein
MTAMPRKSRNVLALMALSLVLVACAPRPQLLNSDRITRQFGSYGVSVLSQDASIRRTSLYSIDGGRPVCRTYAITLYLATDSKDIADIHRSIVGGASIGATFRAHGWSLIKHTTHIGSIELQNTDHPLAALMRLDSPTVLATHNYELQVRKGSVIHRYARIVETHHPDYLGVDELREIYGASSPVSRQVAEANYELVLVEHWD